MSYTLRQAQPLLNNTELLLFKASRRDEIAALTPRELRSKITRARNLRDKFRDLYQRQTAAVQRAPEIKRKPAGDENLRTQKKAEIFAEVLERFENQLAKAEAKASPSGKKQTRHNAPGAPARQTNPKSAQTSRRSTGTVPAKGKADIAMRGNTTRKKADVQRAQQNALTEGKKTVAARGQKSTRASAPKTSSATATKAAKPANAKTASAAAKKKASSPATKSQNSKLPSATSTKKALRKNVATASSAAARGALSTSHTARAARVNTLKESALNKKVHASARSRNARHQAKKDSR